MANEAALKLNSPNQGRQEQKENDSDEQSGKQPQSNQSNARQSSGDIKSAVNAGKSAFNTAKRTAEVTQKTAQTVQKVAQAARTVALLANPWVLGAIAIAIAILLIYLLFFHNSDADIDTETIESQATSSTGIPGAPNSSISIPGVTITLKGPPASGNGEDITYDVVVFYDPAVAKVPIENIVLYDTIPPGATFVGTDGVQAPDSTPSVVTWSLKDPANQKLFHITLHPTANDTYIINTVNARIAAGAGGGSSTDSDEFLSLFTGQGRNTAVLGGRSNFISTIIANASGLPLAGKESYLGSIYDAGIKYNVNPLIIAGIWGTESGFNPGSTYPFGCLNPSDAGFTENVTCAAGSLNQLMSSYESRGAGSLEIPSTIGNTCIYADPFIYAYEMYAPICHADDGNWAARGNLISFYKKFQGI